ncbi:hypothetical protein JHK86_016435 [Glycine max]|nr:hypothetical protein JHK86_016435 [Glycine max]
MLEGTVEITEPKNPTVFFLGEDLESITTISATEEQESLFECRNHVGSHCGNQIVDTLSSHNKTVIDIECCYKLIQMGYSCHSRLTLFVSQTDSNLRNQNSTEVMTKNDMIYNNCDEITKPGSWEFLSGCMVKMGSECGKEVFDKLMHGKINVTKHCCEKLVKMGESCHINMAKALIRTPEMRDVDAMQLLNKGKKMFDQCRRVK